MNEPSPVSVSRPVPRQDATAKVIGRYALYDEFASGGMASLHFGRLYGSAGFARTVAIKRLHVNLAGQPEFVSMLVDEARLAARIRHPNVVPTLDVVSSDGELLLVMEYVHGLSLAQLLAAAAEARVMCPVPVAMAIACDMLRGLHAAHEAKSEVGEALELVHRDVSPQNVLVGNDGISRVVDFGVAKAANRIQETRDGELKGKVPYMAPEQLKGEPASRRSDVYGAGVVLWECLTGKRLFRGDNDASVWLRVLNDTVKAPSTVAREVPSALDEIVLAAVAKDPSKRFPTALEMAKRIEGVGPLATPLEVGAWVEQLAHDVLAERAALLARVEHAAAPSEPSVAEMVSTHDAPAPAAPRSRWLAIGATIAGVAVLTFGVTAAVLREASTPPVPEATAVAAPVAPPATGSVSTTAASAESAPPPPASDTSAPRTALSASSAASAGGRPPHLGISHNKGGNKVKVVKPSCDPPFTTDSAGRRNYKPECW